MDNELLMEYEFVRRNGLVNMFDYKKVNRIAKANRLTLLAANSQNSKDYAEVLRNYTRPDEKEYREWEKNRP